MYCLWSMSLSRISCLAYAARAPSWGKRSITSSNRWKRSKSFRPCGCSVFGCSFMRSTTLITRTFSSGRCLRSSSTAASVSRVGTSPQQAMTTSGSLPRSLLARLVHVQPLRGRLLAGDDENDVVPAAQAVVGDGKKRVGVGRQIDADDVRLLVDDVVDEAGVLVAEAVVVLPPDV